MNVDAIQGTVTISVKDYMYLVNENDSLSKKLNKFSITEKDSNFHYQLMQDFVAMVYGIINNDNTRKYSMEEIVDMIGSQILSQKIQTMMIGAMDIKGRKITMPIINPYYGK